MGTVISNLKARFGVDTSDFKKGLKEGEKATEDFKDAAGSSLDEFASMFGVNMSAVDGALKTVGKSLNFLGTSFSAAAKGADVMAVSMKVLKFALVSTGIGAIVVALGSLIAYFTKSGEGADKFAKILDQVKSVVNNVIERLAIFGKGLFEIATGKFKQGWETMRGAFKGLGDEIKEDWKAAGDLADRFDALEDKEIAMITTLEERRAKAAELRLAAKEETEDQRKRLQLLNQAESLYKSIYGDQISLEKERLAIMKERLAVQTKDTTDEQRKEVAEQEAKISSLIREQAEQLKGLNREKKTALATVTAELALEKAKAEQIKVTAAEVGKFKIPDLAPAISQALAPLPKLQQAVKSVMVDVTSTINSAFEAMAVGFGEFLGAMMSGDAGIKDFGRLIASTFADLAINVGKIAIGTGLAVLGIKKALQTLNPYVAIAAGIALVALGSVIKGALSNAATGAGSGSGSAGGSSFSSSASGVTSVQAQPLVINLKGKLVAEGKDLVTVFEYETTRRNGVT
jgi:hypothetical protein